MRVMAWIGFAWGVRWGLLRLAIAVFIVWVLAADTSARLARRAMSVMPEFDYAAEVRSLRLEGRYGEALIIAESGLSEMEGPGREALVAERDAAAAERDSVLRRVKDVGMGALSGKGDSLEGLLGAVAADMLIVGDVRDLVIQGGKQVLDGESDEVILLLSAAGIVTTVLPEVDWAVSVLKTAKRLGAMTEKFSTVLIEMLKRKDTERLKAVFADVRSLSEKASPGGAARLMRHADSPEDLAAMAKFVGRHEGGAGALHIAGKEGAGLVKAAAEQGVEAAARSEKVLMKASRKGPRGVWFVVHGPGRALLRPHPLLGLAKAVYKGNAAGVIERMADRMDGGAWWMLPGAAAWAAMEGGLIWLRWRRVRTAAAGPSGSNNRS